MAEQEPGIMFALAIGFGGMGFLFYLALYIFCDLFYGPDDGNT